MSLRGGLLWLVFWALCELGLVLFFMFVLAVAITSSFVVYTIVVFARAPVLPLWMLAACPVAA